jgi:hypothetical protein
MTIFFLEICNEKKKFDMDTIKIQLKSNFSPTWHLNLFPPNQSSFPPNLSPSRDHPLSPPALTLSPPTSSLATGVYQSLALPPAITLLSPPALTLSPRRVIWPPAKLSLRHSLSLSLRRKGFRPLSPSLQ